MSGKPFDMQRELRIGGMANAIKAIIRAAGTDSAAAAKRVAEAALADVEHQVAIEQPLPDCPEAWLEGMHDIEQALREAIDQYDALFPR